jgi:MFS family permease
MGAVLRVPGVLPLFCLACVARLPMGALSLLLILRTHAITGSFARGGVVAGAYTLALGLSNPAAARLVDRRGQTLVLRIGAVVSAAAMTTYALLPDGAPVGALIACAAVAGTAQPPVGACMRALWPVLVPDAEERHSAYALEGVAMEIIYICGPVVIVGAIGSWSLTTALLACACFVLVGDFAFSRHPASRTWRPPAHAERHLAGALRGRGVQVLVAVFALCGLAVGAVEVAVPATLEPLGRDGLTGPLLGIWGVGSLLGGLAVARAGAAGDPPRRLAFLLAAWGVAHAALALGMEPVSLGAILLIAGGAIAPTIVYANSMLDVLAPAGTLTEAFTWTTAGMTAGVALGATVAGAIVESATPSLAFALLGGGGVLAALLVRAAASGPLRGTAAAASA